MPNTASTTNAKTRNTKPASKATPKDAIAMLKVEHAEARDALRELKESTERATAKREKILAKVAPALWVHMQIEEEIFYPAFEEALKTSDDEVKSIEARAEHQSAKAALSALEAADAGSTEFRAYAKVVFDLVDHHASEEEDEMFPRVRKLIGKDELVALGERMAARRDELMASGDFRRDDEEREPN
ncbi:MAG: hemerythrin domain-containing protein [Deltaproteobacteria bacterium]|nr:hemerythrin domain-containing protein [Deltaproteobacteria bacterium]